MVRRLIETGRKFHLTILVLISATALLLSHFLTGEQWVNVVSMAVGIYMAGNVGDSFALRPMNGKK